MKATLLSIGDELVIGQTVDTNAAWMASALLERGVTTVEHRTVADDRELIATSIRALAARADLLLITGGLGPTDDDLTRPALGDVTDPGAPLVIDSDAQRRLDDRFAGRPMAPTNRRQAQRPASARCLDNVHGTAPGLAARVGTCDVLALPGPPREMQPMFERDVPLALAARADAPPPVCVARVCATGIGESDAAERLGDLMARAGTLSIGTTASCGVLSARIRATGPQAETQVRDAAAAVRTAWAPYVFGEGDASLAATIGEALVRRGRTLATAESCTGGGIGAALTDVAGSSAWYRGGWVTYDNELKRDELGVPADVLASHGAVSAEVAAAMAAGALRRARTTDAVAVTGIAGPGGGTSDKPVGTVWIAVAAGDTPGQPKDGRARRFRFPGARDVVRQRTIVAALTMLRLQVEAIEPASPGSPRIPLLFEDPVSDRAT